MNIEDPSGCECGMTKEDYKSQAFDDLLKLSYTDFIKNVLKAHGTLKISFEDMSDLIWGNDMTKDELTGIILTLWFQHNSKEVYGQFPPPLMPN